MQMRHRFITRLVIISACAIIAGLCWRGLVLARAANHFDALRLYAFGCAGFSLAAALYTALVVVNRSTNSPRPKRWTTPLPTSYVAKYSVPERIVGVILAILVCSIAYEVDRRAESLLIKTGLSLVSIVVFIYAYRTLFAKATFLEGQVTLETPPFKKTALPYGSIADVQAEDGGLVLSCINGKKTTIHSGMGDAALMIEILDHRRAH